VTSSYTQKRALKPLALADPSCASLPEDEHGGTQRGWLRWPNQAPKQRAEKGSKKAAQHVNAPLLLILPGFLDFTFLNMATIAIPTKEDVISAFPELSALLHATLRPLPGDHAYLQEKPDQNFVDQLKAVNLENAQSRNLVDVVKRPSDFGKNVPRDPHEPRFANLTRTKSGSFEDEDLASILATGAFGANQVPKILRDVEILGIMQARSWKLASLNEFRKFFKLARIRHARISIQIHMLLNGLCDFTAILISSSCILVWLWKMPNIQRRRAAASV
jgi:hypothetical protein